MRAPVPWTVEWMRARARPRLLALNLTIPLLLVAPVALSGAPAVHAAAVYAVLFVLFGTFGSAVPLVRDGQSGLLDRFALTGVSPGALLLQRGLAASLLDLLELLPSVLVVCLAGQGIREAPLLVVSLGASLLVANLLGFWIAALARSVAETALFSAVFALLLLHGSGVFRTPSPESLGARVEALSPFAWLHELLLAVEGAPSASLAGAASALGGWVLAVAVLTWLLAPHLLRAIRRAPRG